MTHCTPQQLAAVVGLIVLNMAIGWMSPVGAQDVRQSPGTDALGDLLPLGAHLRLGTQRFRHPGNVLQLALSPDEQSIVTIGDELIVWDAASGKERWRQEVSLHLPAASYGVRAIAFANEGDRFYTPNAEGGAFVWHLSSGYAQKIQPDRAEPARQSDRSSRSIDVRAGDGWLAIGSSGRLVVCDPSGRVQYEIFNALKGGPPVVDDDRLWFGGHFTYGRFSPDGKLLAVVTSGQPEEIRLVDASTGKPVREITLKARAVRMAFTPDSQHIAVTERDHAVRMYNVEAGREIWSQVVKLNNPFENYTSDVVISPDGQLVAAAATDNLIYLLDAATGVEVGILEGHEWYPWALAFTKDGRILYSSGWDGSVSRWNVENREQLELPAEVHANGAVAASPVDERLAYADDRGNVRLVSTIDGKEERILKHPTINFSQLAFSHTGLLAGGGSSKDQVHVLVWDAADGNIVHRWNWPKGPDPHSSVEALTFTRDGKYLAAAVFRQDAAYVWDLGTSEQTARIPHAEVYGLSFSPDCLTLATAGWDKTIRFSSADTGELMTEFRIPADVQQAGDTRMYGVCFAPEGNLIATSHLDGIVRLWQPDTMNLVTQFQIPERFVYGALTFSPDGLWIATGGANGSVDLWDAWDGTWVLNVGQHEDHAYAVGFCSMGKSLVSGGSDGVCYVWDLSPREVATKKSAEQFWEELGGENSQRAYSARCQLIHSPDMAVDLVRTKLASIKVVINMQAVLQETEEDDRAQRKNLIRRLILKEEQTEEFTTVRRAILLLVELRTPAATQLLEDLAQSEQRDIRELAAAGLRRIESASQVDNGG